MLPEPLLRPISVPINRLLPWVDFLDVLRTRDPKAFADNMERLLQSAIAAELLLFVGDPILGPAVAVRATAWACTKLPVFDPRKSLAVGLFIVGEIEFPTNSLERALAFRPILCAAGSLPGWAWPRSPPGAHVRRAVKTLIDEHARAGSPSAMRRDDFAAEVARRTGASKRQALKFWSQVPRRWRKRGPKLPRTRQR